MHEQHKFKDEKTMKQFKDFMLAVHARNSKIGIHYQVKMCSWFFAEMVQCKIQIDQFGIE